MSYESDQSQVDATSPTSTCTVLITPVWPSLLVYDTNARQALMKHFVDTILNYHFLFFASQHCADESPFPKRLLHRPRLPLFTRRCIKHSRQHGSRPHQNRQEGTRPSLSRAHDALRRVGSEGNAAKYVYIKKTEKTRASQTLKLCFSPSHPPPHPSVRSP